MDARHRESPADSARQSGLSRLVATEEALEARVRTAREQAARIVEQARAAAAAARQRLEADLAPATQELLDEIAADAEAKASELENARRARIAVYNAVEGDRLDVLARTVMVRVIGSAATEAAVS